MAKKPSKSSQPWKPGDPLSFDKAIQQKIPNPLDTGKMEHAADAINSHVSNANRTSKPINNKAFNRQKKG